MVTELVFVAIVVLNVVATRYAFRQAAFTSHRIIAITIIWLVPVLGAIGSWMLVTPLSERLPGARDDYKLTSEFDQSSAPACIQGIDGDQFTIAQHLHYVDRVPLLDWPAFHQWLSSLQDKKVAHRAAFDARRAWLLQLRAALGSQFHLYTVDHVWVLSSLYPRECRALADYVRTTRLRLKSTLANLAHFDSEQPSIVVVVENEDMYYAYIAAYYPDGEFAVSGGMFFRDGCPHLVIKADALERLEAVIVHETTHASLSHLQLPRWLDEGIAVSTEHAVTGVQPITSSVTARMREHSEYWNPERVQEFWSGSSFFRPDEGSKLSYDLANILVMRLGVDWELFVRFASTASTADGGKQAAIATYSFELGDIVCDFLGYESTSEWSPNPERWQAPEVRA